MGDPAPSSGKNSLKILGLWDGAREPIEDETVACISLGDSLLDQAYYDLVRNQSSGSHEPISLPSKFAA